MICFQSIPAEYRNADAIASGFPIGGEFTLPLMGRPVERTGFGQRLFDARTKAGLTQTQLAEKVHMAQSTLAELERHGQGSSKTLQIAAACGVSPEWLATGSDEKIAAAWPLVGLITPEEWMLLPPDVREDALAAVEHYLTRHRKKSGHASGKSAGSQSGASHRRTAA